MKKFLKIAGAVIAIIVLLMITVPYFFRDKIEELVKTEGNKMLNAEFDFGNLDISLIRNFPQASLTLEDFFLKGVGNFNADTLVAAKEITATVDIISLFGDEGFDIKKILLDGVSLKAVVLPDGSVNWDVMKSTGDTIATESNDSPASPFTIKISEFSVNELNIIYDDRMADMFAQIENMDVSCSGDFGSEHTQLNLKSAIERLTYRMDGVPFLNKVHIAADIDVDADLVNNKFTLKENVITLNAIEAAIDGWVALTDTGMDMDLKLNSNKIGFKEVLSLVPAIYSKDFAGLKTDGTAIIEAYAKGALAGDSIMPEFCVDFKVQDAMFKYPSLPSEVNKINIAAKIANPGGSLDNTIIDVAPFNFVMAGNPFSMSVNLKNPISDILFKASAKGKLDLGKIKEIYPLEDMQLNGLIDADMSVNGRMSYIAKEQYEKISATGGVRLNNMILELKDIPSVDIKQSVLTFTPRYLQLSETTVKIGDNDITLDSKFENYLGYALKGTTLAGTLNVRSNRFDLGDFMTSDTTAVTVADTTVVSDTVQTGVISVPSNINFNMQADFKEVLFGTMTFKNLKGTLLVKNGKVDMKNLSLNTMGGEIVVNGSYDAPTGAAPHFDAALKLTDIAFAGAYKELNMVQKLAPIFNGLTGSFSGSMNISTILDNTMSPIIESINGGGSLSTKDLSLNNVKFIGQVADILKKPSLKDTRVKNLNIEFTIADGRINTKPFELAIGDYKMRLSGSTGLDQSIDYRGEITIPAEAGKLSQLGTVDMSIAGTFTSPKVSIDMESLAKKAATKAAEGVLDKLLGGKTSAETKENSDSAAAAKSTKEKVKEKAKDAVKDVLKGLF